MITLLLVPTGLFCMRHIYNCKQQIKVLTRVGFDPTTICSQVQHTNPIVKPYCITGL